MSCTYFSDLTRDNRTEWVNVWIYSRLEEDKNTEMLLLEINSWNNCVFCNYLESGSLVAELLLQLCDLGAGGLSEFGQAGLQSLDVLHQLGGLPFFGPELCLQTWVGCHLGRLLLKTKIGWQFNLTGKMKPTQVITKTAIKWS